MRFVAMIRVLVAVPLAITTLSLSVTRSVEAQQASAAELEITLHEGTALEEDGRRQLVRLLSTYELEPWIFTDTVRIRSRVVPHSHPVLTLNTRYLDDDLRQLSTLVHEQIHWFAEEHEAATTEAIEALGRRYPDVPVGAPEGARSEKSTYLHLIVCWLEWDAMIQLVGETQARQTLSEKGYYTWIYERVLEDTEAIGVIVRDHGLLISRGEATVGT